MPFYQRNSFYLRVSATKVIPLYLYLDDKHIEWMTDRTLQYVISDLRPLLLPKLKAEEHTILGQGLGGPANARRGTVDVHRGDHYQFAYFLKKVDSYSVVLKTRNYVMRPSRVVTQPVQPPETVLPGIRSKRKGSEGTNVGTSKKRPRQQIRTLGQSRDNKGEQHARETNEEELSDDLKSASEGSGNAVPLRRSGRNKVLRDKLIVGSEDEDELSSSSEYEQERRRPHLNVAVKEEVVGHAVESRASNAQQTLPYNPLIPSTSNLDLDEEEEKMKPVLQLHYKGFGIHDRCLCVVVEPYPPLSATSRAPSLAPPLPVQRLSSIAPPEFEAATNARESRASVPPLFLPDFDLEKSVAPAPTRSLPTPMYSIEGEDVEDENGFGMMMAFSQALNAVPGEGIGRDDEDDEFDGSVLFGDADEVREIN